MTQKEQTRLQVLNSVLADQVPVCQAAEVLGVSERHMRRILATYGKEGAAALAHGNRGRRPANTTTETKMTYVVQLARTRYAGTNHTHLTELLMEREGIDLSRSTVRRILVSAGVDSPRRRRPPRHRVRRKRMAQEGMLLQIDGSHHRWLGEQGPRFVLLLAVDDATGTVPDALFSQEEDTRGYFLLMEGLIRQCGIPLAVYSDRHAVSKHTGEVGQKPAGPTQFARAMEELGIRQIFARSPQAKGGVERTAGTFQDRLVTELRLAGVTTIDEANEVLHRFLPRFNEKFGVPARDTVSYYWVVATTPNRRREPQGGKNPGRPLFYQNGSGSRKLHHSCISSRRWSNRSLLKYARSTELPTSWANDISMAAWLPLEHSSAQSLKDDRNPCGTQPNLDFLARIGKAFSDNGLPSGDGKIRPDSVPNFSFAVRNRSAG